MKIFPFHTENNNVELNTKLKKAIFSRKRTACGLEKKYSYKYYSQFLPYLLLIYLNVC